MKLSYQNLVATEKAPSPLWPLRACGHSKDWASAHGTPFPLGCSWIESETAYNFALYSAAAKSVRLLFFADDWTTIRYEYDFDVRRNKTASIWHARVPLASIADSKYYAYSVDGPAPRSKCQFESFRPSKLLLDPYARAIFVPPSFERAAAFGEASNQGKAALCVLSHSHRPFNWQADRAPRHDHDLVIYELHVRGFTKSETSSVAEGTRGTFRGVIEKIPYLQELGITAVELMPVFDFDETEPNYWGYMPLSFFAPHHRFSGHSSTGEQINEFKEMVRALHQADIEVILDVVYNHTGEGNELGPTFSFKGIDCSTYYIPSGDKNAPYADFSGTGNTLNCAKRAVRQLIVDSLRYWVREMHVDGFRFDLASIFSRDADGSINFEDPPIIGDIAGDPDLAGVRLIAEPWEGNQKYPNYQLGSALGRPHFSGTDWRQWNDRFRSTVRSFIKSDDGVLADFITRLYGSSDLFPDSLEEACHPYQSVNYVASHDGPTLYDLVAYTGLDSWNCGEHDGDIGITPDVMLLRKQQIKNFCCVLMLSNGTPMFRAGDEFLHTQHRNTNPYNLDGPLTWMDWDRLVLHHDVFRFFSKMIQFRKDHPSIGRATYWRDDVRWYGVAGVIDFSWHSHAFAYCLRGASCGDDDLYVMINAYWEALSFEIQEDGPWGVIVDTARETPNDFCERSGAIPTESSAYLVQPRSMVVLLRPSQPSACVVRELLDEGSWD